MRRLLYLFLATFAFLPAAKPLLGQEIVTLYSFCEPNPAVGTLTCPSGPEITSLIQAADGNLYGTTAGEGSVNKGTIFRISPLGVYQLLYTFCTVSGCPDGSGPFNLIQGTDGNLYGLTNGYYGGSTANGTVFRLSPTSGFTALYKFCSLALCADGSQPAGALIEGTNGNLYGTTSAGGITVYDSDGSPATTGGVVFTVTKSGVESVLYAFCQVLGGFNSDGTPICTDGAEPGYGVLQASDGKYHGFTQTTYDESSSDSSHYFSITPAGELSYSSFCCGGPTAGLVEGADGVLYGSSTNSTETTTTYDVFAIPGGAFAETPYQLSSVVLTSAGNVLATGSGEVVGSLNEIISVTPAGVVTTVGSNLPLDYGGYFLPPLVQASDGHLNGIGYDTFSGYDGYTPLLYDFAPATPLAAPVKVSASSTSIKLGASTTISWSVTNGYSQTMGRCEGFLNNVPEGLVPTNGTYLFNPATLGTYIVAITCGGTETGYTIVDVTNGSPLPTNTSLTVSPSPVVLGNPVAFTSQVTRGTGQRGWPDGVVTFYTGTTVLGSEPLLYGTATITVGTDSFVLTTLPVQAKFSGDTADAASNSPVVNAVLSAPTSIGISATPTAVEAGQTVTLQASLYANVGTITSALPSLGTVSFYSGSLLLGQATPIVSGNTGHAVATFTASSKGVASGIYPVNAVFSGTANLGPSTATPVYVTVDAQ